MFSSSVIVFAFVGLAFCSEGVLPRSRRSAPYHGPPAPLNHDGTVALTPEVQHARAAHHSAFAEEFRRLHEADSLAAAHPDLTSPPDHGWEGVYASGYQGSAGHYSQGPSYSSGHYNQGPSYSSDHYNQGPSHPAGHYSQSYNPEAHIPAPLNPDGTVAQTDAYRAVAAHHEVEYAKALHRLQHADPHFQLKAAHSYHY